jgi:hypothetical protein
MIAGVSSPVETLPRFDETLQLPFDDTQAMEGLPMNTPVITRRL